MEAALAISASPQAPVPAALPHAPASFLPATNRLQPIPNVSEYLETRQPVAHFRDEPLLWMRLPKTVADEVTALLAAFAQVDALRRGPQPISILSACAQVWPEYQRFGWSFKRFDARFRLWSETGDWFSLVNRAKCGGEFVARPAQLPEAFLRYVAERFAAFKRADGKRQAVLSLQRQWRTGRNPHGIEEVIPGYEAGWDTRDRGVLPRGWTYQNLLAAVKRRGLFTAATRLFLHEGESAARGALPVILGTREGLRFLEVVTFDDVRTDWLILNPASGQAEELWLLLARDLATTMALGFVMHPATIRADGTAVHLGLAQMKQLAGWLLERYPLPPYVVTWKIERGTATLSEGVRLALGELFGGRIAVSYTSMIGSAASPAGYREKKKGNSRGKASHESHNRLLHTQGAFIAGQTGNRWDIRPAELPARSKEAIELFARVQDLPEHLRNKAGYPLLTVNQAREYLFRLLTEQNTRTNHALEGFEEVVDEIAGRHVKRMESPVERAARLVRGYKWTPVSPHIVRAFYEHTERQVIVKPNGEIEFTADGRSMVFAPAGLPLVPGTKALGYFHPDDPQFLHLTDGRGAMLGTWVRRGRVAWNDEKALADAMRYTHAAREAAREAANALAAPERAELEAMRATNAELLKLGEFTDVAEVPAAGAGLVGGPAGAGLTAIASVRAQAPVRAQADADFDDETDAALREALR